MMTPLSNISSSLRSHSLTHSSLPLAHANREARKSNEARGQRNPERPSQRLVEGFEMTQSRKTQFLSAHSPAVDLLAKLGLGDAWEALNQATGAITIQDLADFDLCSDDLLVSEVGLNQQEIRALRKATALVMNPGGGGEGSAKAPSDDEEEGKSGGGGGGGEVPKKRLSARLAQQRMDAPTQQEASPGLEPYDIDNAYLAPSAKAVLGGATTGAGDGSDGSEMAQEIVVEEEVQLNPLSGMQGSSLPTDL